MGIWAKREKERDGMRRQLTFSELLSAARVVVDSVAAVTDPSAETRSCDCLAGLECIINVVRALRMGSCLSAESRSPLPGSLSAALEVRKWKSSREKQGKKGTNQDAMIVWENFCSRNDTIFCGVFDGHGPYGHMVAKRVRDSLPLKLSSQWEVTQKSQEVLRELSLNSNSMNSEDASFASADEESRPSIDREETKKHSETFQTLKDSFLKAFKVMDRELKVQASIDCFCSGTTAVTLIKQDQFLVIGNLGDSRAVLGTRDQYNSLIAVQLTVDHKPNLPAEAERIRKHRGRVFALRDEPEVARVWLPTSNAPGLAMARAFGDFCLKNFGLVSVPDLSYRRLTHHDEFIVLATDGIWDVLSNKEVVDLVASAPTRSTAARLLVETAVRAWKMKYLTSKIDDCAVICLFLDSSKNNISVALNANEKDKLAPVENTGPAKEKDDPSSPTRPDHHVNHRTVKNVLSEGIEEGTTAEEKPLLELGMEWSALEGGTCVNALLNLPRFVPTKEDKKSSGDTTAWI
ncbi:hypothetical protein Nepgr_012195 [Nepenthes gracilis]|uniref:protein-serine/threonine phosphatase n=1 Tax=Nepenthes gracilis TaxID=150966 RepID=A0AAD3SGU9_NEPGR|nr:hypothetical protein Nepgr_012195 [Nepenthes gracilis]